MLLRGGQCRWPRAPRVGGLPPPSSPSPGFGHCARGVQCSAVWTSLRKPPCLSWDLRPPLHFLPHVQTTGNLCSGGKQGREAAPSFPQTPTDSTQQEGVGSLRPYTWRLKAACDHLTNCPACRGGACGQGQKPCAEGASFARMWLWTPPQAH